MKKILTLTILVLLSVTARAQYIDGVPQSLERRAGHLYTDDGTRLSQAAAMSLLSEDMYGMYSSGRHLYKAGVIVSSIGGGLGAIGITIFALSLDNLLHRSNSWVPYLIGVSFASAFAVPGAALLLTSIPLFCIANARLKKAAEGYSPRTAYVPQLSLGAQPSGIGLGIRF